MYVQRLSPRALVSTAGHDQSETRPGVQVQERGLPADLAHVIKFLKLPETLHDPFLDILEAQQRQQEELLAGQIGQRCALQRAELVQQEGLFAEHENQQQIWIEQQLLLHKQTSAARHNAPSPPTTAELPGLPGADVAPAKTGVTARRQAEEAVRRQSDEKARAMAEAAHEARRKAQVCTA